jgi:hypothetical protein
MQKSTGLLDYFKINYCLVQMKDILLQSLFNKVDSGKSNWN